MSITGMGVKLLQLRERGYYPLIIVCALLAAFLLDDLVLGPKVRGMAGNYLLPTLMWFLFMFLLLRLPKVKSAGKLRLRRLLCWLALVGVFIAILAVILQGIMGGFGKSPYDHSGMGIIINILSLGTALVAMELCRAWLINRFFKRRPLLGIAGISLLFTFFLLPLSRFSSLQNVKALTEFIGVSFFPGLAQNVLTTYLAFWGGPIPAVIYRGGLLTFERLSPLLPSGQNWVMAALIGTLTPVITLILVQQIYKEESKEAKSSRHGWDYLSWLGAGVAAVLIVWFCLGVFSYSPRVVLSGSMVPVMNVGDVVIIHKIPGTMAQMGDIVMFPVGSMKVTHRIIAVEEEGSERYFTTKGDASGEPESDLLAEKDVQGKVVMIIPKLGYLTLLLRGAL